MWFYRMQKKNSLITLFCHLIRKNTIQLYPIPCPFRHIQQQEEVGNICGEREECLFQFRRHSSPLPRSSKHAIHAFIISPSACLILLGAIFEEEKEGNEEERCQCHAERTLINPQLEEGRNAGENQGRVKRVWITLIRKNEKRTLTFFKSKKAGIFTLFAEKGFEYFLHQTAEEAKMKLALAAQFWSFGLLNFRLSVQFNG